MRRIIIRHKPSPTMIVGLVALFVALSGTSYAAIVLPKNSVGTQQIKPGGVKSSDLASDAVTSREVKDGSLLLNDFKPGLSVGGSPGPQGPKGDRGPKGDAGAAGAAGSPGVDTTSDRLVGSWMVSVNRGPALPPFKSLQTFTEGGGLVTVQNLAAVNTSSYGAWARIDGLRYGATFVLFRFDPSNGSYIGTIKFRCTLELAPGAQSFTSLCTPEVRDPDGNLLPGSNNRREVGTAERINVEPPPALP